MQAVVAMSRRWRKQRACGKTRYRDDLQAKRVLQNIATFTADDDGVKVPVRWYRCKGCRGVHLTSMTLEQFEATQRPDGTEPAVA